MNENNVALKRDSKLQAVVCLHCKYHLFCKYNQGRYGGIRTFVVKNIFDPSGVLFGCDVFLPGAAATDRVTIDIKWNDIEEAGRDAWEEVQKAIRH